MRKGKIRRSATLTNVLRDSPQSLQVNAEIVSQIRSLNLPSASFSSHYALNNLPFDNIIFQHPVSIEYKGYAPD
jgi:hypothetical protein